jgi:hypothetical protein
MKDVMKIWAGVSALLLSVGSLLYGQAVPNTTISSTGANSSGFPLDGTLHYAMTASEIVQFGFYGSGETTSSTNLSADAAYTSKSENRPFSMVLAGGVGLANGQGQGTYTYWNLAATQGLITRRWAFNISDSFSFLPQSPTTGLSGIPGVGDLGALPVQGPTEGPGGGVLTYSGDRVINQVSGSAERQLSSATSISGVGSWSIIHFLDDNAGLDSSSETGSVALNRRLDARSSASLDAVYSTYSYGNAGVSQGYPPFQTKGINLSFQRLLSRSLSMSVSAGPLWISSSDSALVPSRLSVAASASLSYNHKLTNASLGYTRGANAGSGVLGGALSDNVSGSVAHTYGRKWVASADVGYTHSTGLQQFLIEGSPVAVNQVYDTVFGGVQLTRGFGPHWSGYTSYTIQHQSSIYSVMTQNAFIGNSQVFAIGVTFTPRTTRLGQF